MSVLSIANSEFARKLMFEKKLISQLQEFNRVVVREFIKQLSVFKNVIKASVFDDEMVSILQKHYEKVGGDFSHQVLLPEDVVKTAEENSKIEGALVLFYALRSAEQVKIINNTTQSNMDAAAVEGEEEAREQVLATGQGISATEAGIIAGVILARKLRGRVASIATTETQTIAEKAKSVEINVLLGQEPSTVMRTARETPATKEWVTFGDEKVRPAHIAADGQIVKFNEPFIVDGEQLMEPKDDSLGASAGNIINCRCSSITPPEDIAKARRS